MIEAIRFENEDEAWVWDAYVCACIVAGSSHTYREADEILLERRKRLPVAQAGEDGLPEEPPKGWRVDTDGTEDWTHTSGAWVTCLDDGFAIGSVNRKDRRHAAMMADKRRFPTRAAAIAAVEAHLRGGE